MNIFIVCLFCPAVIAVFAPAVAGGCGYRFGGSERRVEVKQTGGITPPVALISNV